MLRSAGGVVEKLFSLRELIGGESAGVARQLV